MSKLKINCIVLIHKPDIGHVIIVINDIYYILVKKYNKYMFSTH